MKLRTKIPVPNEPFVDYLRFVLPWGADHGDDEKLMFERARRRIQAEIEAGACTGTFADRGRYRFVFAIPLSGEKEAIVRIGALDPARQKGGISVSINPAKLKPGDVEHFHEVMERIVGRSYKSLLRRALLNRVDFAVDIVHARLDRMLVSYSYAQQFTVFGKTVNSKGIVETCNFGSESSDYITAVYDKSVEQRHRAVDAIAKCGRKNESLKANFIKQLDQVHGAPPVVRVEVRGVKMNGLALHDVANLTNRFARFTFVDLNAGGSELPQKLQDVFVSPCRDRGVKAALDHFKGTPDVRKVNGFWRSRRASWWKPEPMMAQALAVLRESGIFPGEAFVSQSDEQDAPRLEVSRARRGTTASANEGVKFKRTGPNLQERRRVSRLGLYDGEARRDSRGRIA